MKMADGQSEQRSPVGTAGAKKILVGVLLLCAVVGGAIFLCVTFRVVDRSVAEEKECDCTVYYLCDAANIVSSSKCSSPEVCCRSTSPILTTLDSEISSPHSRDKMAAIQEEEITPNCECVPAADCPEVSGANLLNIRLGKSCPSYEICCPVSSSTGGEINPNQGGWYPTSGGGSDPNQGGDGGVDQFQECGVRRESNQQFSDRITGGPEQTGTSFGEYPWMMAVLTNRVNKEGVRQENVFNCGATLILPHVVMTAAHCVNGIPLENIKVRGGDWDTSSTTNTDREPLPYHERTVSQIYIHERFEPTTVYNDIALIILDFPFPVKDHIGLICTPNSAEEYDDQRCLVTGWGKDKFGVEGRYQSTLKKLDLKLVPRNTCQQKLRQTRLGGQFKLHESFICAAGGPNQDACKGDGGGPLICQKKGEPNRYTQVGIVAWGIGCGSDTPGVYVDVRKFKKWILDNSHGQVIDTRIVTRISV